MRKFALSFAAIVLVASPALAGKYNKKVSVGDKAPTFSGIPAVMKDQDCSISLADCKEDVVVIAILANHCPAVVGYQDRVIDLAKSFEGKSVKFVGVAVSAKGLASQDDLGAIKKMDKGYPFVYGYDASMQIGKDYGATNTPQFFVLDKARTIRYMGALDDNNDEASVKSQYVKTAVNAILSGKEIETTETKARGCGISYSK